MRITRETLLKLAQDYISQRQRSDRGLLGVFLQGSLLEEDSLLGGITDIDIFLVHNDPVAQAREVVRISDEIHLDLAHHARSQYRKPRELRQHPWLGDCINGGKILYDPQHFLDFTQASVRGQFNRADTVLARSHARLAHARQIWLQLQEAAPAAYDFLRAVEHAANAVAGLVGPPLTERRLLRQFQTRADTLQRPGLAAGLLGLLGASQVDVEQIRGWLPAWQTDYQSLPTENAPVRLHAYRFLYYQRGVEALLDSQRPKDALWPLLRTWSALASLHPADRQGGVEWEQAARQLGLAGEGWSERLQAMDAYLDTIDEFLETWGQEHGA